MMGRIMSELGNRTVKQIFIFCRIRKPGLKVLHFLIWYNFKILQVVNFFKSCLFSYIYNFLDLWIWFFCFVLPFSQPRNQEMFIFIIQNYCFFFRLLVDYCYTFMTDLLLEIKNVDFVFIYYMFKKYVFYLLLINF